MGIGDGYVTSLFGVKQAGFFLGIRRCGYCVVIHAENIKGGYY